MMLRTNRPVLRPPEERDVEALGREMAHPEVARWWPGVNVERVRSKMVERPDDDTVVFIIEHDGEVVGAIQYYEHPDPEFRHAGVDLFVGRPWWGRGFATEAIRAVVAHLIDDLGHHRVVIDRLVANTRAVRVDGRVGFRPVGVLRRYQRMPDGHWHDGLLLDLLADEFERPTASPRSVLDGPDGSGPSSD